MSKPPDDLEAIRTIAAALEPFEVADRQRILRYVLDKLNLTVPASASTQNTTQKEPGRTETPPPHPGLPTQTGITNLSSFVNEKSPKNDVQFAATVAYFHRFEAPPDKRKTEINAQDLQDACRLAPRKRFKYPGQTLRNAKNLGLLDNGSKEGFYAINSVGENLVAMTLPSGVSGRDRSRKPRKPRRPSKAKKVAVKK
jgi:hypothetical protein